MIRLLPFIFLLANIGFIPYSFYETALIYETGNDSIAPDAVKSSIFYRLAAENGDLRAQNYLGFRYYNGEGVTQNVDSALYWIRSAAENGDIKAAGNMGYLLSKAPDVKHDYQEALQWLTKAADAGLPTSFTQLGDLYREGKGTHPDTLKAKELYEKAIDTHIPDAELRLLSMMGYKWKELSPDSALKLGLNYYKRGAAVIGVDLFQNAAKSKIPKAFALLADAYAKGRGVAYDNSKALDYNLQAALLGDPTAAFILAEYLEFYLDGIPADSSLMQEFGDLNIEMINSPGYWYSRAAEKGVTDAEEAFRRLFNP